MPFKAKAVQFEISNVNHGLQTASGLLKLVGEQLVLEFQLKDAFFEVFKSDVEEITIPLRELQSVELKKGWFSSKIILEARSLRVFDEIPGTEGGECKLKIKRKDRKDAENLVSKIRLTMSEMKLKDLDDEH
ncbi:hypothetical protein NC796_13730 [Aliifodinibius sp. S!AR15-10]|uniref:hypothetical protein n=1 Tax=Aliifodinibius sp. S!AR15-10 TaxID=2950437 RepID=UPI00285D02FB|nr:hypothetical protein [Aliifodinibius sp. S!AR15-10]MDR8392210.1 hypothetical protein [Aliifodinibius sp. S!AR15-10]